MKRTWQSVMDELDPDQRTAARAEGNAVVAAGAGSGKTRVLAARYLYLVIERAIPVDKILTLTFTKKAASEMYGRIYSTLRDVDHPLARKALEDFHLARIQTIDAFCGSIAREACRAYGIAPDFAIDNDRARDLAEDLALRFFLEKRRSPAIRQLLKRYAVADLPAKLFAETAINRLTVTSPPDFASILERQSAEILRRFASVSGDLGRNMARMADLARTGAGGKTAQAIAAALESIPDVPDPADGADFAPFLGTCARVASVAKPGRASDPAVVELKELLGEFKDSLYPEFLSISNYLLNRPVVEETFSFLGEFQERFNRQKKESGILTFADVSRLALDALTDDPVLRASWKRSTSAIMVDEFQDDNSMQRDLFFLIAERPERNDRSVPTPGELCPDKLFFVGDEKQSIYRFRGADVSVFRKLADDLASGNDQSLALRTNYRTETALVGAFNAIFPSVFVNPALSPASRVPLYEATFEPIAASKNSEGLSPSLDILVVDTDAFTEDDPRFLSAQETEAAEVARAIRELLDSGYLVRDGKTTRPCASEDIAILFRSGTRQHLFERFLRERGIPSRSETLRGLFSDAPINDLYALLRLAVYPEDNLAYATVLRSPFVGASDLGFASALLARRDNPDSDHAAIPRPFDIDSMGTLSESDRARMERGAGLLSRAQSLADRESAAGILTRLWYDEGYRYNLLSDASLHRYAELYDYFFELARQADERGETLATFLDRMRDLMASGEKIDGLDIPSERSGGVTLMTVHKSKGLEFPIVFLVDAGNAGRNGANEEPVYWSDEWGPSINTGGAEEAEEASSNWFYEAGRAEERSREQAELRRLLYVAMTRAETRLFVSACAPLGGDANADAASDRISAAFSALLDKKDKNADAKGRAPVSRSFLDLLLPTLSSSGVPGVSARVVLPALRDGAGREATGRGTRRTVDEIRERCRLLPLANYPAGDKTRVSATSLHALATESVPEPPIPAGELFAIPRDPLDELLARTGIPANDFGTFAHRAIESRFTGIPALLSEDVRSATERMADLFFSSALGKKAAAAVWRRTEYGFLTRWTLDGRDVAVSGQIDLLFEHEGTVYVVDYKTDRVENPDIHAEQLAVYRKAVSELRKKPAETWIFYLRTGNSVHIKR